MEPGCVIGRSGRLVFESGHISGILNTHPMQSVQVLGTADRSRRRAVQMPIFDARNTSCHSDNMDRTPRPVVAVSAVVPTRWEQTLHRHRRGHLLYSERGIINCEIDKGIWIVPPKCAIWIPGSTLYSARGSGETETYCLYIEPDAAPDLPGNCCTLGISPLTRELLFRVAQFPSLYPMGGREERTVSLLLDELSSARAESFHFPIPAHPRLRRLADALRAEPAKNAPLAAWARSIGMSERTLTRALRSEIGMSFGAWRRQLHVVLALQLLSQGETVHAIAIELGYDSASSFVTTFRKTVGKPPARYMADCHAKQ